jgi:hypothetical protein
MQRMPVRPVFKKKKKNLIKVRKFTGVHHSMMRGG